MITFSRIARREEGSNMKLSLLQGLVGAVILSGLAAYSACSAPDPQAGLTNKFGAPKPPGAVTPTDGGGTVVDAAPADPDPQKIIEPGTKYAAPATTTESATSFHSKRDAGPVIGPAENCLTCHDGSVGAPSKVKFITAGVVRTAKDIAAGPAANVEVWISSVPGSGGDAGTDAAAGGAATRFMMHTASDGTFYVRADKMVNGAKYNVAFRSASKTRAMNITGSGGCASGSCHNEAMTASGGILFIEP
jgi:hypothetical protein